MTIAVYATDLVDVSQAETTAASPGTWAELSGHTTGGAPAQEDRAYLQGSFCISQSTGTATALTLNDKDGNPIAGAITGAEVNFTFAYSSNTQGGRSVFTSPGGDVPVTIVAGNKGIAKPAVATTIIQRIKTNSATLTAEQDRAYVA